MGPKASSLRSSPRWLWNAAKLPKPWGGVSDEFRVTNGCCAAFVIFIHHLPLTMIIVMKPHSSDKEIEGVVAHIESLGYRAHLSKGEETTIIGVIGDDR